MKLHFLSALLLLAVPPGMQGPIGTVNGVSASPGNKPAEVIIRVTGVNPCGAVHVDPGDGSEPITHAIEQLPFVFNYKYPRAGAFQVRASGMGNCTGLVTGTARVSAPPPPPPVVTEARGDSMRFAEMDRNGDGVITPSEWRGNAQSFRVNDRNNDGILSGAEVRADASVAEDETALDAADRFEDLDVNRNGRIERREWQASVNAFEWLDRNNDNVLSRTELASNTPASVTPALFASLDLNADQRISMNEWHWSRQSFEQRDANGDGGITRRELAMTNPGDVQIGSRAAVVRATQAWTDSGLDVRAGDLLSFTATGIVRLSGNASDVADPRGARSGRFAPDSPMPDELAGALIGRIGNSPAFVIGSRTDQIRAPGSGRLYLGVNDDYGQDNSGEYRVTVSVRR